MSLLAAALLAWIPQHGDIQGEPQPPLPTTLVVPAAPALSAEQERATFALPSDLEVELVACEPLVEAPVHAVFDARGRLWVVEMRGYMPDVDGNGEREPVGRIALLTDVDGDGRMDRRTTFLDHLVLPRSIAITRGGALVIAPPNLLFAVDEDDDGVADDVTVVDKGLDGITSPEYGVNGLLPTLDNAFACACASWRYVFENGQWKRERTAGGGQWGITKDDFGRVYFNGNSDPLRGDFVPSQLACRNANAPVAPGVNARVVDDLHVKPARVNPGVNRGYKPGTLGSDWKLDVVTGACGPWIHRGDALPERYKGDAFVCEPCGNLVVRYELAESVDGSVKGAPARNADGRDFLTSTDERFRPVNLFDGPDGALYVVDFRRGVLQHRQFLTTWLRKQAEERGLATPLDQGRIWRVRRKGAERKKPVDLTALDSRALVKELANANGWTRDTAQRLLVEQPGLDAETKAELVRALLERVSPVERVHALWTLAAHDAIDAELAPRLLWQFDDRVLAHVLRACARPALAELVSVRTRCSELAWNGTPCVRREAVVTLASRSGPRRLVEASWALSHNCTDAALRAQLLASIPGGELELLHALMTGWDEVDWSRPAPGRAEFHRELARVFGTEGRGASLDEAIGEVSWPMHSLEYRLAFLDGLLDCAPMDAEKKRTPWFIDCEPKHLLAMTQDGPEALREKARELAAVLVWPGKPGSEGLAPRVLADAERARFAQGRELYAANCVACHQSSGRGDPALAPPLRRSPFVLGDETKLVRILLHGLNGPIDVLGQRFDSDMPAFALTDTELAALATYVRREWGNTAEPVTPETVARVRTETRSRKPAWTVKELDGLGR